MWSPGGKETTHINRGTDFYTTPSCLLTLALPLLLSLSLSSSSSPPSAFSFSFAAWSSQLFRCYLWMVTRETVPLPVKVAQWQPRFLRDGRQTEQHSGGDVCVEPVFMWMVTLFYSQYFLQDETYTWGLQITAQTDESSVELVLTSWVWHDKSLI